MAKYKRGQVVRLRSGGPEMTVKSVIGEEKKPPFNMIDNYWKSEGLNDGDVICVWFEGNTSKEGGFSVDLLDLVR